MAPVKASHPLSEAGHPLSEGGHPLSEGGQSSPCGNPKKANLARSVSYGNIFSTGVTVANDNSDSASHEDPGR